MRRHLAVVTIVAVMACARLIHAQMPPANPGTPLAPRFLDPVSGVTLSEAIARALEHEPDLRGARADIDVARGLSQQAAAKPNPTVSFAQQMEPAGTDAQTRVELDWPLDLFRKAGRVNVAERELEAAQHATADRERLVISAVRLKFGEVLAAVRDLSVADDLVAMTAQALTLTTARVDEGTSPPLERDMVRVELQRLEAERLIRSGHAERALIELKRLLGLTPDAPLALRENLEEVVRRETATGAPSSNLTVANRPDVGEAQARVTVADAQIDRARREGRFDVSVFGMYMRMDAGFPQRGFGPENQIERVHGVFHYWSAGVSVSVPILDRKDGEVVAAQAQRVGAQAQFEARQLTAQSEIAATRARDDHARKALAIYTNETMALARNNLDVVSQTYELGRMTILDVLDERRRYLETERAYTNALREAYDARQALRTALGDVQ